MKELYICYALSFCLGWFIVDVFTSTSNKEIKSIIGYEMGIVKRQKEECESSLTSNQKCVFVFVPESKGKSE